MTINEMTEKLKRMLTPDKFEHSIGTMNTAIELAEKHNANVEDARIAGLLHDCAKCLSNEELLKYAKIAGIIIGDVEKIENGLLHAPVGAYIAKTQFGIKKKEILEAISKHTTGAGRMSTLAKIIYIADCIAPDRNFSGIDEMRKMAQNNLDEGVLMGMNFTIKHVIGKNRLIDLKTIKARNVVLKKILSNRKEGR